MRENWRWDANVILTVRRSGVIVAREYVHNVVTRGAFTLVRDSLRGSDDPSFIIVGIGANADPVSDEDTDLGDERLRVDIIRQDPVGVDGLLTTAHVAPAEANTFTINEIGWWGGAATESLGSGTLMSRVLFTHTKNNLESLQIDRLDTFAEAP